MNLYAHLLNKAECLITYEFGADPHRMTGILEIDLEKGTYQIKKYPDEPFLKNNLMSFANRILHDCLEGDIKEKASREIG